MCFSYLVCLSRRSQTSNNASPRGGTRGRGLLPFDAETSCPRGSQSDRQQQQTNRMDLSVESDLLSRQHCQKRRLRLECFLRFILSVVYNNNTNHGNDRKRLDPRFRFDQLDSLVEDSEPLLIRLGKRDNRQRVGFEVKDSSVVVIVVVVVVCICRFPEFYSCVMDQLCCQLLTLCSRRERFPSIVLQLALTLFSTIFNSFAVCSKVVVECFMKQIYIKALIQSLDTFTQVCYQYYYYSIISSLDN
jgi:hypothetical protein